MAQVFRINRRFLHYKFLSTVLLLFLIFVNIFEITYHYITRNLSEEPIDVVYTWVNGSDPKFRKQLHLYLRKYEGLQFDSSPQRYDDKNELKFSLRSLEKYAPWIRHVFIITNGQVPQWLNLDYEKVSLITHDQIFDDKFNTPTFSSPAIETHLHRIPGLSKRFIYFNDDVFLRSPVYKDDFISPSRGYLIYLAWLLPMCSQECLWIYVADGHCDSVCNNRNCQMDGGDCDEESKPLIGDVIVKFDDYQMHDTEVLTNLNTSSRNFSIRSLHHLKNVSELIEEHNKKVILLDKMKRRKVRKKPSKSRNIDAYAESLQHTNRILNEHYGFSVRKVPAHAPIMIDKDTMAAMVAKFFKYFEKTTRNRVRSADDVQFTFAYYYFVIHEKVKLTVEEIFDQFDADLSGWWSDTEIRTVIAKLYDLPITEEILGDFATLILNCSGHSITKKFVSDCRSLSSFLELNLGKKHKYKFELIKDAEKKHVSFKMLNSNATEVLRQLDDIRKHEKKFVCLNDNLDHIHISENQEIKRLMLDFYMSLFPNPSKFELPDYYRNKFLYMDDYLALINKQNHRFLLSCILLIVIILMLFLNFFRRLVCEMIERCFC